MGVRTLKHVMDWYGPKCRHQRAMGHFPVVLSWQRRKEAVVYRTPNMDQRAGHSLFKALLVHHLVKELMTTDEDTIAATQT